MGRSVSCLILALFLACSAASAQVSTPGEIPKPGNYQGSVELERRRQEAATTPSSQFPGGQSTAWSSVSTSSAAEAQAATLAAYRSLLRQPVLPPARNPLLGRWSWQNVRTNSSPLDALVESIVGAGAINGIGCSILFGDGIVEFRPDGVATIQRGVESKAPGSWTYRGSSKQVTALKVVNVDKGETGYLLEFDLVSADRIRMQGGACEMTRVAGAPAARTASAAAAPAARGTSATPVARPAAPAASPAPTAAGRSAGVPAGRASAASSAPAVKSQTYYRCAETIYVFSCRRDQDKPGFRPTSDSENYCTVYYPDRPKASHGGLAGATELERDVAATVQACKAEPAVR